jgi:hypothetical protein
MSTKQQQKAYFFLALHCWVSCVGQWVVFSVFGEQRGETSTKEIAEKTPVANHERAQRGTLCMSFMGASLGSYAHELII